MATKPALDDLLHLFLEFFFIRIPGHPDLGAHARLILPVFDSNLLDEDAILSPRQSECSASNQPVPHLTDSNRAEGVRWSWKPATGKYSATSAFHPLARQHSRTPHCGMVLDASCR